MIVPPALNPNVRLYRIKQRQISLSLKPGRQARQEEGLTSGSLRLQWYLTPAPAGKKLNLRARWQED